MAVVLLLEIAAVVTPVAFLTNARRPKEPGDEVPIPTFPDEPIRMVSTPLLLMAMLPVAGDHIPVLVLPVNVYAGVPTAPKPVAMLVALATPRIGVTSVGVFDSTTAIVPVDVATPVPPLATGSMPDTCVVKLTPDNVPPSVSDPLLVTVPVNVMPLTVPVPPTEVTVPTKASFDVMVKDGYVPDIAVVPAPVRDTT